MGQKYPKCLKNGLILICILATVQCSLGFLLTSWTHLMILRHFNFRWGLKIKKRMGKVEQWAEKQGLELAADCHLARVVQAAHLLQARKNTAEAIASVSSICFKLNSVQLRTLLNRYEPSPGNY